jgi:hypothetical protein
MKAIIFFTILTDILIFLAGLLVIGLVLKIVSTVFGFIAENFKSMLIACAIIYAVLLYSLNCTPYKMSFFYDILTICTKQSNS